ncbi:O-antigen ligase family protein [Microlunatus flavus]|uniref:O-antigen ligase n=1 Tax=Microlunatus flavus TaxID=1036181 RepID=A0A1H9DGI6_9ACTN|nr:O-antigen ligase family protein [Microlunatus flavus]SEQ12596.1 O-antigen ligase [Microlunatus flavus]
MTGLVLSELGPERSVPQRVRSRGVDGATVLTVYLVLLLAIPSVMVLGPLGSAGAPSTVTAVALFLVWLWFQVDRTTPGLPFARPVRRAALVWLLVMVVVYAHAMASPIPFDEISPADFGMLKLVGFTGVLLVASDGLSNRDRYRTFVSRLVLAVFLVALLGLLQFVTKDVLVDRIHIPGLTSNGTGELINRGGLPRPSGTSTHPIEYGVVLSMAFPLAVVHALKAPRLRWLYAAVTAVIALDIVLSSSRSALVCSGIAIVVLALSWSGALRLKALAVAAVLGGLVYVVVPSSLGATTKLFTQAGDDPSIASRTGSYDLVATFFAHSPVLGRGFGTFLPKYWILDNGYLGLLIEGGVLGLGGLLVLILTAAWCARAARRRLTDDFDRQLAQGLLAAVLSGAAGLAFFDTFGFPQSAGCFFLVLGLAGGLYRLSREEVEAA